jgi:hypothetical protein
MNADSKTVKTKTNPAPLRVGIFGVNVKQGAIRP